MQWFQDYWWVLLFIVLLMPVIAVLLRLALKLATACEEELADSEKKLLDQEAVIQALVVPGAVK